MVVEISGMHCDSSEAKQKLTHKIVSYLENFLASSFYITALEECNVDASTVQNEPLSTIMEACFTNINPPISKNS